MRKDARELFKMVNALVPSYPKTEFLICKNIPRYESDSEDPNHDRAHLSEYSNYVRQILWLQAARPGNIRVVDLNLHCYDNLRLKVYGEGEENDGVLPKGPEGQIFYTKQFIKMIKESHVL